ncbi:DUF6243 family protein [Bailinhaonella thermotolerans]|uniref:Uncharacterized protein n=1 Tax=Bailinhaonella thermotolerans TaxID=1070861 RepID=A0A3A4A782_9ACTN|nr:DUF6243 family protein [Bailinhaonella thermotolerans]RJL21729.1 hypothetical protein D5H75_36965 [Bailinhaonella thermotolerans]
MGRRSGNLLGVGGQRKTLSRDQLRGKAGGSKGGGRDSATRKQELLRKMRELSGENGGNDQGSGGGESAPQD